MVFNSREASIVAMGDSHISVFKYISLILPNWSIEICEVGGATAQGAVNPNSKTNALSMFSSMLDQIDARQKFILLNLGEVDCGFVIWYRAQKYNENVQYQLLRSTSNYISFIQNVVLKKFCPEQILIASALPPSIEDNIDPRFLCGARADVKVNIYRRTRLTFLYNEILRFQCEELGFKYVDVFTRLLLVESGIIDPRYKNENPWDHHLSPRKSAPIWIDEISKIIDS